MKIGLFTKTEDGTFEGRIETLSFAADVKFIPAQQKTSENAPDYQVISVNTEMEIGAGWHAVSERTSKPYLSLKIDDPAFAYPIWAALTLSEAGEYSLNWTRPKPKPKADIKANGETL